MDKTEIQKILNKWEIKMSLYEILSCWSEPQRHYHTQKHLEDLLTKINQRRSSLSVKDYEKLIIVALFHDIVYNPMSSTNEDDSGDMFIDKGYPHGYTPDEDIISKNDIDEIYQAIIDTKSHKATTFISKLFCDLDMSIIGSSYADLLELENGIYNEFKGYGNEVYKKGRLSFLRQSLASYPTNADNLNKLISWVEQNY